MTGLETASLWGAEGMPQLATSFGTGAGATGAGAAAGETAAASAGSGIMTGIGWGLLAGLVKNLLIDEPKRKKQVALQATTAELSPWTGMKPDMSKTESRLGENLMQFGMTGASLGQGIQQLEAQQAQTEAQKALTAAKIDALRGSAGAGKAAIQSQIMMEPLAYNNSNFNPWSRFTA